MVEMIVPASTVTDKRPKSTNMRKIIFCGNSIGFSSGSTKVCNPTETIHMYSITEKKAVQNKNCTLALRISIYFL